MGGGGEERGGWGNGDKGRRGGGDYGLVGCGCYIINHTDLGIIHIVYIHIIVYIIR